VKKLQIFESVFPAQAVSIETSSGEYFGVGAPLHDLGIANAWSIVAVIRPDQDASDAYLINIAQGGIANGIRAKMDVANNSVEARIRDSSNAIIKEFGWNNQFTVDVWAQIILTWDGTTFRCYRNGVLQGVSTAFVNNAGTMTNTDRKLQIGAFSPNTATWLGNQMYYAIFDYDLAQADVTTLHNSGDVGQVDLNNALTTGPVHWWRLGQDSSDIGKDSGSGVAIDVITNSVNITSADIESEFMSS
jgi:hypothetical protein